MLRDPLPPTANELRHGAHRQQAAVSPEGVITPLAIAAEQHIRSDLAARAAARGPYGNGLAPRLSAALMVAASPGAATPADGLEQQIKVGRGKLRQVRFCGRIVDAYRSHAPRQASRDPRHVLRLPGKLSTRGRLRSSR